MPFTALLTTFLIARTAVQGPATSPTITRLIESMARDATAESRFWEERAGKGPLVEPMPGRDDRRIVTFLYRGASDTGAVLLYFEVPTQDSPPFLSRAGTSQVWHRSVVLPASSRFTYALEEMKGVVPLDIPGRMAMKRTGSKPDSLNASIHQGRSLIELPAAPKDRWSAANSTVAAGRTETWEVASKVLGESRPITVYVPAGFDPKRSYDVVVALDAEAYGAKPNAEIPLPTILDNLQAKGRLRPTVAVLVSYIDQSKRMRDLTCNEPFVRFVADEVLPAVRKRTLGGCKPGRVAIAGSSLGGLQAAFTAFRRPDTFQAVLAQGGSFWYFPDFTKGPPHVDTEFGWLTSQIQAGPRGRTAFYLGVDLFEQPTLGNVVQISRGLRDTLRAKGYLVQYEEYAGGHEYLNWRIAFGDALAGLMDRRR